jgi:hypothetical protein
MFYLINDNSDLKSVFTYQSISTRSLKVAPMLICFDNFFLNKSNQPSNTLFIKCKFKKLPTRKGNLIWKFSNILLAH